MNYNASIWLSVYMAFMKLIESLFLRRHQLQFEGFFGEGETWDSALKLFACIDGFIGRIIPYVGLLLGEGRIV